jgi:D-alanyl-D-alanine carboxypeptidase
MKSKSFIIILMIAMSTFDSGTILGQMEMTRKHIFPVPENWDISAMVDRNDRARGNTGKDFEKYRFSGTASFDTTLAQLLQAVIDNERISQNLMGISAAARVPGEGIWLGVSGVSDPSTSDSIRPDMIFGIGSITKTFIAALTLQLVEEEQLSLDDSLHQWLPAYQYINSTITIRQLLNHTSGIDDFLNTSDEWFFAMLVDPWKFWTPEEVLTSFLGPPAFTPGTQWGYSNTNYILLGMIINQITQTEISTEMRNRFGEPLGMNSTFLAVEDSLAADRPHNWQDFGGGSLTDLYSFPHPAMYSIPFRKDNTLHRRFPIPAEIRRLR